MDSPTLEEKGRSKIFRTAEWSLWAAHALSGTLATENPKYFGNKDRLASRAADIADAMAREKQRREKEER